MLSALRAFFSPSGRVLGKMCETVVLVSSTCSSRKLHRQSTRALYVGGSLSREDTEVRFTEASDE